MNPDCPTEIHPFTNRWARFNEQSLTPEANAAWVINQEKGYFGFLPNPHIKHLIIGSFPIWASVHHDPPHLGFDFPFFYCSRKNGFFKIMEAVSGYDFFPNHLPDTPYQKVQSISDFFLERKVGITDIIWKVKRTDARCMSASDKKLNPLTFNCLCRLLTDYPEVTDVYFTSLEVGNWCRKHMENCALSRIIKTHNLFSPSPAADRAASGILNRDRDKYGNKNSIEFHSLQLPILNSSSRTDLFKVVHWAKRLRNVPGLVRPEILENPNYIAIEDRL